MASLRKDFYPTWQEASSATQALGITKRIEYRKRYKEDFRLPASPYRSYSDFPGFRTFFARKYATWQEAGIAAQALSITKQIEYRERYKGDPRLPANPNVYYGDFPDFVEFLGKEKPVAKYATWQEAGIATQVLGITTRVEYRKRYKEDPELPYALHKFYDDFPGFRRFLGKDKTGAS